MEYRGRGGSRGRGGDRGRDFHSRGGRDNYDRPKSFHGSRGGGSSGRKNDFVIPADRLVPLVTNMFRVSMDRCDIDSMNVYEIGIFSESTGAYLKSKDTSRALIAELAQKYFPEQVIGYDGSKLLVTFFPLKPIPSIQPKDRKFLRKINVQILQQKELIEEIKEISLKEKEDSSSVSQTLPPEVVQAESKSKSQRNRRRKKQQREETGTKSESSVPESTEKSSSQEASMIEEPKEKEMELTPSPLAASTSKEPSVSESSSKEVLAYRVVSDDDKPFVIQVDKVAYVTGAFLQHLQVILPFSAYRKGNVFLLQSSIFPFADYERFEKSDICLFKGTFQAFRMSEMGPILNVDLSYYVGFQTNISLLEWIKISAQSKGYRSYGEAFGDPKFRDYMNENISGIQIKTMHGCRRKYKLSGLDFSRTAANTKFVHDGKEISIQSYMKQGYSIELKEPGLPLVIIKKSTAARVNNGQTQKEQQEREKPSTSTIHLPLELCWIIPGQQRRRDLTADERNFMINKTRMDPSDRIRSTKMLAKQLLDNAHWKKTQVDIDDLEPIVVRGFVLEPVLFVNMLFDRNLQEQKGEWSMRGKHFLESPKQEIEYCLIVPAETEKSLVEEFIESFRIVWGWYGARITSKPLIEYTRGAFDPKAYEEALRKCISSSKRAISFAMILLASEEPRVHDAAKRMLDNDLGVPSKCLVIDHPKKIAKSVLATLVPCLNAKIGGIGWAVDFRKMVDLKLPFDANDICIMGFDVCHGKLNLRSGQEKKSAVALCATTNALFTEYHTVLLEQSPKTELVERIGEMVKEALKSYQLKRGRLPSKIIFFRDGVGEGMYELVERKEIRRIKEAFSSIYDRFSCVQMTFVIVQKRNHLRTAWKMINTNNDSAERKESFENAPVGTLIYSDIVDKEHPNFYLYSHHALQGTARPTHYQVLLDELKAAADIRQFGRFVFSLTHLYQGCTKSVSYPTIVFLADKAAGRCSQYFEGKPLHPKLKDTTFMI